MKTTKQILILIMCILLVCCFAACKKNDNDNQTSANEAVQAVLDYTVPEPDLENAKKVVLSDKGSTIDGSAVKGKTVCITEGGVYLISGTLSDGRIIVNAPNAEVTLALKGANISCSDSSSLYVFKAEKVTVYLLDGSENSLADGEDYDFTDDYSSADDKEPNACLYSKSDLIIGGSGSLTVNAKYKNGITCKDELRIDSAKINIAAENHGINGKDLLTAKNADITVKCGGDAIRSTNDSDAELGYITLVNSDFSLTSGEDAIQAETVLTISGGKFSVKSGGGSANEPNDDDSSKGLKAETALTVLGGEFELDCCDDALHSNGSVEISGGTFAISTGDDGIHADSALKISGGIINISKSYEGLEGETVEISGGDITIVASDDGINAAGDSDTPFGGSSKCDITISGGKIIIDASGDGVDSNGSLNISGGELYISGPVSGGDSAIDFETSAVITGGTVIAAGSSGMAENFGDSSTQGSILLTYQNYAGGEISVSDSSGKTLIQYTPTKNYNCIVVSCPSLEKGGTYTVSACGESQEITLDSLIYGSGNGMGAGMPGMGGGMGGQKPDMGNGNTPPELPSGETPSMPNGEMPSMPDGEMPSMPDGEAPSMPSGERPTPPNGGNRPDNKQQGGNGQSA